MTHDTTTPELDAPKTYTELVKQLRADGISVPRIAARARKLADGISEDGYVDDEKVEKLAEATSEYIEEVESWARGFGERVDTLTLILGIRADLKAQEVDLTDLMDLDDLLESEQGRVEEEVRMWAEMRAWEDAQEETEETEDFRCDPISGNVIVFDESGQRLMLAPDARLELDECQIDPVDGMRRYLVRPGSTITYVNAEGRRGTTTDAEALFPRTTPVWCNATDAGDDEPHALMVDPCRPLKGLRVISIY